MITCTAQDTVPPEHKDLPLDILAARVGDELATLAQLSADVQKAISACEFVSATQSEAIRGMQGIDRITQSLEDLGRLMAAVSGEMPRGVYVHAVPILSRLRLHELTANLDPKQKNTELSAAEADGQIEWF